MNTPTKITMARIASIIIMIVTLFALYIVYRFNHWQTIEIPTTGINLVFLIIFVFFLIASYTDHLDGYLARKNNQVTDLGKFLDPVADKLLINSMIIFLVAPGITAKYATGQISSFSVWCAIIFIARDIVVDALRSIAAQKGVVIAANIFGKLKTVLQMVAISAVLLNDFPFHYMYPNNTNQYLTVTAFLIYLATLVSFLSGLIYVIQNKHAFLPEKKNDSGSN